ncbi:MAG: hypothetical protein ACREFE_15770 [Limisphaerales bacterium]
MTNTVLTFILAVLAVAGVIFALQSIFLMREFRTLTVQATIANSSLVQAQSLANDVAAYNQKVQNPELTKLLHAVQSKPAAR